jgi:hypothetical protein
MNLHQILAASKPKGSKAPASPLRKKLEDITNLKID